MKIIPAEVTGYFRKRRNAVQAILLVVFLGLPWIHIGAYQSILLNIPERKFAIFGVLFQAHEVPLLFFLVAISFLSLALVTSIWGRVWCGWACPQTVFIDAVYRRIEIWIEGGYIERRRLDQGPLNLEKILKRSLKWILFVIVSSAIAHSFMAYFVGSRELIEMMKGSPEQNWSYFVIVSVFTFFILADFAWFREQFCIYACPYGRFQSVLLEPFSLAIAYDVKRGEPRRSKEVDKKITGDCVSCQRCVQVCPTGIDIRNGLQMECINCTACADACDEIMTKVNKPTGLIGYKTLDNSVFSFKKLKPISYFILLIICVLGMSYTLSQRQAADITVLKGIGLPYSILKNEFGNEVISNHFRLHIKNQRSEASEYELILPKEWQEKSLQLISGQKTLQVSGNQAGEWHFFVQSPLENFSQNNQFRMLIQIKDLKNPERPFIEKELILIGPKS